VEKIVHHPTDKKKKEAPVDKIPVQGPMKFTTYKGVHSLNPEEYKINQLHYFTCYQSTSKSEWTARHFATKQGEAKGGYILKFNLCAQNSFPSNVDIDDNRMDTTYRSLGGPDFKWE